MYEKCASSSLKSTWAEILPAYRAEYQFDPHFELTDKVKRELAKLYLAEVEEYIQSADDQEINRIAANLNNTTNPLEEEEEAGEGGHVASEPDPGECDKEHDDESMFTLAEMLRIAGIDSESEESFAAFDEGATSNHNAGDDSEYGGNDMSSPRQTPMSLSEASASAEWDPTNGDEADGDEYAEVADSNDYDRVSVGQRVIKFLTLTKFANFTFSGHFESGAEGALLLRECLLMGVPVRCTFQGRHVTSLKLNNHVKIINLRTYLPSSLFKMASQFKFLRNWTWFPSHEIVRANLNEVWNSIPEPAWWRDYNILDPQDKHLFGAWHGSFGGEYDFNRQLVRHIYHRAILIMKVAMQFSHETMALENALLHDQRKGLLAGDNPIYVNSELTYVSNNHPLSKEFSSMAGYAFRMFNRFSRIRLPILQYHRHDNPASRSSMQELAYLEWLYVTKEHTLQFALRGNQKCFTDSITGTKMYVDGYVEGSNKEPDRIFEILGCYHHGCTLCFPNGSPFQRHNKISLVAANKMRHAFLSKFGKVVIIWSHTISQMVRENVAFKTFYKKFTEHDFRSFGWREGHTTGIVEAFGIYAHADAITEHWKKHRSDMYYRDAEISQIDMNANYPSTLMRIKNKKLAEIIDQPAIPIPVNGLTTLFTCRIKPPGSCPPECWKSKCRVSDEDHEGECSIAKCHISCIDHFNPDFFDQVSGMAHVLLLPPRNIIYPLITIPLNVLPPRQPADDTPDNSSESDGRGKQSQSRKKIVNFLSLCRECALQKHLCRKIKEGHDVVDPNSGDPLHSHSCDSCQSNLNFHSTCHHSEGQRAFDKVLPLNELSYILREGYTVLRYHSIQYFSENCFWAYDEFMTRLSTCKVKAKGLSDECLESERLRETLTEMRLELDDLQVDGPDDVLREQFTPNPTIAKLCKLVGCLIIGKLAMDNDHSFTKIVHSFDEFTKLQRDETLIIESYHLLNPHSLLVTVGTVEGGDRDLGRSSCLLLASMVTAAARVNMFKVMNHLYRNEGYLTLYLGVDSLIVVPFAPWALPIEQVLPMHESLSGYFGFQHESVESAVIYGRNRYSVFNRITRRVEFKFSGLSGIRNAGSNDVILSQLHKNIAQVLLSEVKLLPMPQAKIEISRDYMSITMTEELHTMKKYHILDLKRGFFPFGIVRDYCFRAKVGRGID
jgi:hypothetical protein